MDGGFKSSTLSGGKTEIEWWRGAVIYQIYPRSFFDSNGDGIGDLPGITQKLDYVADLGVDGIWISPFYTSPMADFGYDVADYCDVDPIFGTLSDFHALVERAHALNLRVIVDQIYAHTSDRHDWFQDSRASRCSDKSDWYVWHDPKPDGSPPNNWQAVFGGPCWTWDARRQQYYMHNFLKEQPQLNVHNRDVQDALLASARFWLDAGVDGFRFDAINFSMHNRDLTDNPPWAPEGRVITRPFDLQHHVHNQSQPGITDFLERIRAVMNTYGIRFSVAEVGGPDPLAEMRAFTTGEGRLSSAYNFDFLYAETLTAARVKASSSNWVGKSDREGWPSWAFSNHDAPRYVSRWHDGSDPVAFAKLANALLLSLRGNPILYQGEELGLAQADVPFELLQDPEAIANWPLTLGRDGARTPLPWVTQSEHGGFSTAAPWLPVPDGHVAAAVDRQAADPGSVLSFVREMLAMRSQTEALRLGDIRFLDASEPLLVFERRYNDETIYCVFNLGGDDLAYDLPGASRVLLTANMVNAAPGTLPRYGVWIAAF